MRILYQYIFDVTKKWKRDELIPFVLQFMQKNSLKYADVLFELSTYKDKRKNRKTYFEKLCEKDIFWQKYSEEYKCSFAKDTYYSGVSNLKEGEWIKRTLEKEDALNKIISKLEEQLKVMPQDSYKIAFNNIKEFGGVNTEYPWIAPGVPRRYPLSSNITILKDYPQKRHIVLSFEMSGECKNHRQYVEAFSDWTGCSYTKEVQFVKDDAEQEIYAEAYSQINKILGQIKNTKINMETIQCSDVKRLHIKKILANVFSDMELKYEGNGVYDIEKIDTWRNKLTIYFDYDRELRCLSATLAYRGLGYKYGVMYSAVKPVLCDRMIEIYAEKVRDEVERFKKEYVPIITGYYKPMPEWYEWE